MNRKMKKLTIAILNSEMDDYLKTDSQLRLLQICVDVYLKNESYKAFFQILQL